MGGLDAIISLKRRQVIKEKQKKTPSFIDTSMNIHMTHAVVVCAA